LAYAVGESVDQLEKAGYQRLLGQSPSYNGVDQAGDHVFLEHTYATDGAPNGFFYVILRRSMLDAEVFRILSTVVLIVLLSLVSMTALLVFSLSTVLRPIRELRAASSRVEREDYGVHVHYRSPDELGELANTFNRMSGAIAERTSSLRQALREQQDFLEHTTRELRTPLNIFRWTLEMMRFGDTGRLNREQLELIEQLNQTNERLIGMVQKLQDAIRIDQRRLTLKIEDAAVEDVIDEVAGALSVASRTKNQALHWNRPKTPMPRAYVDREYLRKVLSNLVGNAVKYTPANGHIEIDVEEAGEASPGGKKGRFLRITVEDNGMGIPKDDLGRVFTRFFRAKNVTGGEIEGTGLGLYIAKQIVELHGGKIWIESREGVGTTVAFTVPTEKPQAIRQTNATKHS
jgi:signal transduction histidine kinase